MGKTDAKLDVVITTGGRFDMLEKCLDALYKEAQLVPLNIYIIDNASPSDERIQNSSLFQYDPAKDVSHGVREFRSKRLTAEVGFPSANNEGARMGHSPLILFLNDDVEIHPGTLEKVLTKFEGTANNNVGVVGIKLIFPPTSTSPTRPAGKVQHVGIAIHIQGYPYHPLVGWSPDNPKTCITRDVFAVTGAFLMIRRNVFSRLNGFDTIYNPGTFEDVDLCLRVRQLGLRIIVDCDSTAYHYVGATQEKKKFSYPLQLNLIKFQGKWTQSGSIFWTEEDFY